MDKDNDKDRNDLRPEIDLGLDQEGESEGEHQSDGESDSDNDNESGGDGEPASEEAKRAREELLRGISWKTLMPQLIAYATARARGNEDDGLDHAMEACARALDPKRRAWDPAECDFKTFLEREVNNFGANERAKAKRRKTTGTVDSDKVTGIASPRLTPENEANLSRLLTRCENMVRARFGEQGIAFLRVALETPAEQAAALGMTENEVYRLKRNVFAYCRSLDKNGELRNASTGRARRMYTAADLMTLATWAILEAKIAALIPKRKIPTQAFVKRVAIGLGLVVVSALGVYAMIR